MPTASDLPPAAEATRLQYQAALETSMDGFFVVSVDGRFLEANGALCAMTGCSRAELLGERLADHAIPPPGRSVPEIMRQILESGRGRFEAGWRCRDGSVRDVEVSVSPARGEAGVHSYAFLRDVTERKRIEAELRREKELLETATASGKVTIWEWDLGTGRLEWSGYVDLGMAIAVDRSPLTAAAFLELTHPDDRSRVAATIRDHAREGTPFALEFRVRRTDGSYAWWRDVGAGTKDESGRVVRLSGACTDVTELKEAELALMANQERLEEAQRAALLGHWKWDLLPGEFACSPEIFSIFELGPAESRTAGETLLATIHPDDREAANAAHAKSVAERTLCTIEYRLRMSDGRVKWVHEQSRTEYAPDGTPIRSSGTIQDITDHRLALEAHRLAEAKNAAEAANRAKSAFLASMSHEIRTPMNAILGFSQLLLGDPGLTAGQLEQLRSINRSGEHLLTLIDDVLEMSKIEAGRITLNPAEVDLHAFFWDLETLFRLKASGKGLNLRVERASDLPRYVVTDEVKLRQILINLIGNAVKFTTAGSVTVRAWSRPASSGETRLLIGVEDTGPGIPPEDLPLLFHRFEQTRSGQAARTGTGLGLAISQGFAGLMGGEITVRSRVGSGSIFNVDVAVGPSAEAPAPPKGNGHPVERSSPDPALRRILVADDLAENREVLCGMLSRAGFEVRTADDGREAIDLFSAWRPNLVLMDVWMPGVDGLEAIRAIRGTPEGRHVPIVAVTASTFQEDRKRVEEAGGDAFLAKPFREADLLDTVGTLLERRFVSSSDGEEALASTPGAPSLGGVPGPLRGELRAAVVRADLDRVLELAGLLEREAPAAAIRVRELAGLFEYGRLLELLEERDTDG